MLAKSRPPPRKKPHRPSSERTIRGRGTERPRSSSRHLLNQSLEFLNNKSKSKREGGKIDSALIQYAETEMRRHEVILENCIHANHSLSGKFLMPSDNVSNDRAAEKRAMFSDRKAFSKPLSGVAELRRLLNEAPNDVDGREKQAYHKWVRRKLDAFFALRGKNVELPPPKLVAVLNSNASKAKDATIDIENEKNWKNYMVDYRYRARDVFSLLKKQREDWSERRFLTNFVAPSYEVQALHTKPLVDWKRNRVFGIDLEQPTSERKTENDLSDAFTNDTPEEIPEVSEDRNREHSLGSDLNLLESMLKPSEPKSSTSLKKKRRTVVGRRDNPSSANVRKNGGVGPAENEATKDSLLKQVRAKRYLGGGIRLSSDALYKLPMYEGPFRNPNSIRRSSQRRNVQTENVPEDHIKRKEQVLSEKDEIIRKLLRTKEDMHKEIEDAVKENLKNAMSTMQLAGARLEKCSDSGHTISYPSVFTKVGDSSEEYNFKLELLEPKSNHHGTSTRSVEKNHCKLAIDKKRLPTYFDIEEKDLERFFNEKGDVTI